MIADPVPQRRASQRDVLARCISSILVLSAPAAFADNLPVASCLDDDVGNTLRKVLLSAHDGDVVDLSALSCPSSTITLTTGGTHLIMPLVSAGLTIKGPQDGLTIDGQFLDTNYINYSNILYHTGTGTLTVQNLTLTGGHESHKTIDALGGCIYSKGNVTLDNSKVQSCTAYSLYASGKGGGVFAKVDVTLVNGSTVSDNVARSSGSGMVFAGGGGIYAKGDVAISGASGVSANTAQADLTSAYGGGIFSTGNVNVTNSEISANTATAPGTAFAGGIGTSGSAAVFSSFVDFNHATSTNGGDAAGGGVFAQYLTLSSSQLKYNTLMTSGTAAGAGSYGGGLDSRYSAIRNNAITGSTAGGGAGVRSAGNVTLANTTVSNNTTNRSYSGIDAFAIVPAGKTLLVRNSTISSNSAGSKTGGLRTNFGLSQFYNSTIAFNTAASGVSAAPGVHVDSSAGATSVVLQSTIMSNNTYGSLENDLSASNAANVTFNAGPAPNIVRATFLSAKLPSGNLFNTCPLLGPLRFNGGLTKTHALMSKSAAIDTGNNLPINPSTMLPYAFDQRGSADSNGVLDYPRVSGPVGEMNPKPDIGAYEVQQDEIVFNANFEGCPALF